MMPLIEQCLANNAEAWADLWLIFDHAVGQPLRQLLHRAGFQATDADDVTQEIYLFLREDDHRRLRSFRGTTERELKSWIRKLAINFMHNWVQKRWLSTKRDREFSKSLPATDRSGATEPEVVSFLKDLESIVSDDDTRHLRILAGLKPSSTPVSKRTLQLWRKQLQNKIMGISRRRRGRLRPPPPPGIGRRKKLKNL